MTKAMMRTVRTMANPARARVALARADKDDIKVRVVLPGKGDD
jgi:hypothetical protein